MANEHIGRKQAIGLGKESTSGTAVVASDWIPKMTGSFKPSFEKAIDDSAYGVIDEVYDSQTTKNMTSVELEGIARDGYMGHFLLGALGNTFKCQVVTLSGISGGTPARGDVVSSATDSWTGVIRKIIDIGGTDHYVLSTTSGTLTGSGTDLTDTTWTASWTEISGVEAHVFTRLNTNAHPSFTLYGSDDVGDERAAYCMLSSLEIESAVGEFAKLKASFMGKKLESTGAQSPSYNAENPFLAKHSQVYFANDESGLNAASATPLQMFKLTIEKNLKDVQDLGSDDISSIHNQQFGIRGDMEALYNSTVLRDYVSDSTKKAMRFELINTEATALATGIYPSVYIDIARASFEEWDRSGENNDIVSQTMGYSGEFDVTTSMAVEVVLLNSRTTAY